MSKVDQAIDQLKAAGFTLILASRPEETSATDEWGRQIRLQTPELCLDLKDLLQFPKGVLPIIFFSRHELSGTEFEHTSDFHEEAQALQTVTIDLRELEPRLKRFQKYMYEAAEVEFFAPYNGLLLTCQVCEDWYTEFLELKRPALSQAREQLRHDAQARREAQALQEQEALRPHEQRIRLLLDDAGFLKLARVKSTAQRTLLSYARTQEPAATSALGEERLKDLLAEIRDWVLIYPNNPLKAWLDAQAG